jgi:hypothetical protein
MAKAVHSLVDQGTLPLINATYIAAFTALGTGITTSQIKNFGGQ